MCIRDRHKINKDKNGNAPIRYDSIEEGLKKVASFALQQNANVNMPRIGCCLLYTSRCV